MWNVSKQKSSAAPLIPSLENSTGRGLLYATKLVLGAYGAALQLNFHETLHIQTTAYFSDIIPQSIRFSH